MENNNLKELSLETTKKADDILKKSKKLKTDMEELLQDVKEASKKYKTENTKKTSRK
jgi:type II secretory pathway component PulM